MSWDQDVDSINLTLIQMKGETQDLEFGESGVMTLVATATGISRISPELDGVTGSVALKTEGTPSDGYLVTLEGLPLTYDQEGTTHDYTYCFSEDQVANYNAPVYKLSSGGNVNDRVASGGSIENSPEEAYRLPATGGMGSWGFYLSGGLLVLAVGMILVRRQRRLCL